MVVKGNFLHCWWACPKFEAFWHLIQERIFIFSAVKLSFRLEVFLLSFFSDLSLDLIDKMIVSVGAQMVTASKWKD